MEKKVVLITGSSSGFGKMSALELADAGNTVYASMRDIDGNNAKQKDELLKYAKDRRVDIKVLELDVKNQESIECAVGHIMDESHQLDVVVHNAGHMTFGPTEAFTAEQLADLYDTNVLSTHRINRSVVPFMRKQKKGLIVWVSSTSTKGGTPPYLGPYFAAKAAMDSLAVSYSAELSRWGIETSIIVPGAFTKGTNHFAHAGKPEDEDIAKLYEKGPYSDIPDKVMVGLKKMEPEDADPSAVSRAIARVVSMDAGKRPFRVHIDPSNDGCETVNAVADHVRSEFLQKIDLADLMHPRTVN